ncbi:MAG: 30S ribosomal protein S7 [Lentisphaerae bacterium]|nr:30S ribosomal protein S7 [Lentisphaerota bacterium]
MARRHSAERREIAPDLIYNNQLVAHLIHYVMRGGKKATAEKIIYGTLEQIKAQTNEDPLEVMIRAIDNIKPKVEVKSRRVGGATYQVPVEVSQERQVALALRWLITYSRARKGQPMVRALSGELMDAYKNQGNAIKKRDDTHKMAQANKAFAHYKW